MMHPVAFARAFQYARLPLPEVHDSLFYKHPRRGYTRNTIERWVGIDSPHYTELIRPLGTGYSHEPMTESEVRPLREQAQRLGLVGLTHDLAPRLTLLGRQLQSIAFGKHTDSALLARALMQNPGDETTAGALHDALFESDHPLADAVEWRSVPRALHLDQHVEDVLTSALEHPSDIYAGRSARLIDRVRRHDFNHNFPGLTDQEIIDSAHRVAHHTHTLRHGAYWMYPDHMKTQPGREERAMTAMNYPEDTARWGGRTRAARLADALRYRGPQPPIEEGVSAAND